jgi:hypothetical protein
MNVKPRQYYLAVVILMAASLLVAIANLYLGH